MKDPFENEGEFNAADDISGEEIMDKVEEIAESAMSLLERAKKILENYHKKHSCYEHERAALAVQGAMNFVKKAKPVDGK